MGTILGVIELSPRTVKRVTFGSAVLLLLLIGLLLSPLGDWFRSSGPEFSTETRYDVQMLPPGPDGGIYFEGRVIGLDGEGIANAQVLVYRNMYPSDERLVIAPIPQMEFGRSQPASVDPRFGQALMDVVSTDDNGYYQASVDKYEKVEVVAAATGYHLQDTRILPALGVQRVDIYPIRESEPGPRPAQNAPFVLPEGLRVEAQAAMSVQDQLKERAVASLQCHGIDVTAADITGDVEPVPDFSGVFKTSIRVRSDDCDSVEARTITYDNADAKTVPTTKGTFTLVNNCANLIIPQPEVGFIKIFKFEDLDGDGQWDAGEPGVPGFKFRVTGEGKDFLVTTGAGGVFISGELPVGTYTVTEIDIPEGWEATTPTERTVEVTDGALSEVRFGNKQIPPPPPVTITGRKVELVGTEQFPPIETFTFEIVGRGITTVTDENGDFRFENVELFTLTGPDSVSVEICEQLPSSIWEPVDPPDGCKTLTINKGETSRDFGVWENRTTKEPGPEPSPTPTPTPGPCSLAVFIDSSFTHVSVNVDRWVLQAMASGTAPISLAWSGETSGGNVSTTTRTNDTFTIDVAAGDSRTITVTAVNSCYTKTASKTVTGPNPLASLTADFGIKPAVSWTLEPSGTSWKVTLLGTNSGGDGNLGNDTFTWSKSSGSGSVAGVSATNNREALVSGVLGSSSIGVKLTVSDPGTGQTVNVTKTVTAPANPPSLSINISSSGWVLDGFWGTTTLTASVSGGCADKSYSWTKVAAESDPDASVSGSGNTAMVRAIAGTSVKAKVTVTSCGGSVISSQTWVGGPSWPTY